MHLIYKFLHLSCLICHGHPCPCPGYPILCKYRLKYTAGSTPELNQCDCTEIDAQDICTYNTWAIFQPDPFPHLIIHRDKHYNSGSTCEATALPCFAQLSSADLALPGAPELAPERGNATSSSSSRPPTCGAAPAELPQPWGRGRASPTSQQAPDTEVSRTSPSPLS